MRVLIAVKSCHANAPRRAAQLATWVKDVPSGVDVRFFVGVQEQMVLDDSVVAVEGLVVVLAVGDSYKALPSKTRAMCKYAVANGYDYVFLCDDDTYVQPGRLMASGFEGRDYVGRLRGSAIGPAEDRDSRPATYCSGFAYWLSLRALRVVADHPVDDQYEDRMVGNALLSAGISPSADYRYVVVNGPRNAVTGKEGPMAGNYVVAAGEVEAWQMPNMHEMWQRSRSRVRAAPREGLFRDVSVMVKTFLRDGYLRRSVPVMEKALPGAKIVVVDDGRDQRSKVSWAAELRSRGHEYHWLPFDSGFCAKSNLAADFLDTPYMLVASDDFDFEPPHVEAGVRRMMSVLEALPEVGVASGRVDGVDYQCYVAREGRRIVETRVSQDDYRALVPGLEYCLCHLTVNYNLVRREVFHPVDGSQGVRWHGGYKIGGDHFQWYDSVTRAGWLIAHVRGVDVRQMPDVPSWRDPSYTYYRGRARYSLPKMFAELGIDEYVGMDGRLDKVTRDGDVIIEMPVPPRPAVKVGNNKYQVQRDVFTTSDPSEVVFGDNPKRRNRIFRKGAVITAEEARKYSLI